MHALPSSADKGNSKDLFKGHVINIGQNFKGAY